MDGSEKVTRNGQTLTARMWEYLETSYAAAGLDPDTYLVVTQGSYKSGSGASASGSTHDAAGAADLRTWNLPSWAREDLCEVLIVELRERGGCAWYRDESHGGMDPHIHVILRGESPLSSGAADQVKDYDAGRNGLSNHGPDYHPRPAWSLYEYGTAGQSGPTREADAMLLRYTIKSTYWLVHNGSMTSLSSKDAGTWTGPRADVTDETTWGRLTRAYPANT